jgi:hypothetical protein
VRAIRTTTAVVVSLAVDVAADAAIVRVTTPPAVAALGKSPRWDIIPREVHPSHWIAYLGSL